MLVYKTNSSNTARPTSRPRSRRSRAIPRTVDEDGSTTTLKRVSSVPWWGDLDPAAAVELQLPPFAAVAPDTADVVVIGGGVAGLSAALSARKAGAQVVLLERETMLGYGATGRNAGILSAGVNMSILDLPPESPEAALWPETTRLLLSLAEEARRPDSILSARLTGAISLAESATAAYHLVREVQGRTQAGLHAELWTPQQVEEYTQGRLNTASVMLAMWLPDEGRIHPLTLLAHLARQARAAGVQMVGQAQVAAYQEEETVGRHGWRITLADGNTIKTAGLISSVGPTVQANARIYALAFAADLPDNFPLFWDASPYTYADYRPGNGRLSVSGGRYGKAGVMRHDATYYNRLADGARNWLPELAGLEPLFEWAVDLAVTAETVPGLRALGQTTPSFAIEGLGALGVLPGMLLGQRAGQQIAHSVQRA